MSSASAGAMPRFSHIFLVSPGQLEPEKIKVPLILEKVVGGFGGENSKAIFSCFKKRWVKWGASKLTQRFTCSQAQPGLIEKWRRCVCHC